MEKEPHLKCLHCGHLFQDEALMGEPIKERTCPKCRSNSVRRIKPK